MASDPTKHKGMVIVPVIKLLGRVVCLTQQNMAVILAGLFASPNKVWQSSWQAVCHTQRNMAGHSANQIARNNGFFTLNNVACKFLAETSEKPHLFYNVAYLCYHLGKHLMSIISILCPTFLIRETLIS